MIIVENATGAVTTTPEPIEELLAVLGSLGLTEADVTVYATKDAYLATPEGQARVTEKAARAAKRAATRDAITTIRANAPHLANPNTLAAIYALYPAVDAVKVPNKVKQAVSLFAQARGIPDVTGLS